MWSCWPASRRPRRKAAIFLDVDGVLAPIVPRPEDARVPDDTRVELRRLHERYALVACVSGRSGPDARRVVDVPELIYVGNHGLELAHGMQRSGAAAFRRSSTRWTGRRSRTRD